MKDLVLPNAISQKDEKPHTAKLDDTAILHIKIKTTVIAQYHNTLNPHVQLLIELWVSQVIIFWVSIPSFPSLD